MDNPATAPAALDPSFLGLQIHMRVGEPADDLRALLHVECNGTSGVSLPACYAGEENDRALRVASAAILRAVADALDRYLAEPSQGITIVSSGENAGQG